MIGRLAGNLLFNDTMIVEYSVPPRLELLDGLKVALMVIPQSQLQRLIIYFATRLS